MKPSLRGCLPSTVFLNERNVRLANGDTVQGLYEALFSTDRIGKHAEAEPSGKSRGFPQCHIWNDCSADGSIKDRWKRAYYHVSSPFRTVELIQSGRDTGCSMWAASKRLPE
jgi:hypothetical protein